jgi:hypothetical protein
MGEGKLHLQIVLYSFSSRRQLIDNRKGRCHHLMTCPEAWRMSMSEFSFSGSAVSIQWHIMILSLKQNVKSKSRVPNS